MENIIIEEKWISIDEAAEYLGVNTNTILDWIRKESKIPAYKIGNQLKFKKNELDIWINDRDKYYKTKRLTIFVFIITLLIVGNVVFQYIGMLAGLLEKNSSLLIVYTLPAIVSVGSLIYMNGFLNKQKSNYQKLD